MCSPGNSEPWHIDNHGILRTLTYLKPHTYAENSQRFKMKCFTKIVKSCVYFSRAICLKSLKRFWIHQSLNKYSSTCRVTSRNVLYEAYSEPCTSAPQLCVHSWWGFAEGILQVVLFTVLCFKWAVEKHCVAKILQWISERFLCENNRYYNSYKFSYKFDFIPVFSFRRNQKQEYNFQQVGDW